MKEEKELSEAEKMLVKMGFENLFSSLWQNEKGLTISLLDGMDVKMLPELFFNQGKMRMKTEIKNLLDIREVK